ncbi:MAG TPA: band 7 protein [Cyanobacteria bacterium UBA8803]|nr:band 7 protein [Cyanobacteria bacterium UBA9273]HBL57150.1 band 7 protein [Cyanobacteria bacterium UBA8803]
MAGNNQTTSLKSHRQLNRETYILSRLLFVFLILAIASSFFVIVNAGQRGVLMQFGQVQPQVLGEGIHFILPLVNTVQQISVRVQKQEISTEASSKDLQDVFTDVALNWHIIPEEANAIFQQIGDRQQVIERIINPAVEEVLKAVMAQYTAEEIITKRGALKTGVDNLLTDRLSTYHITVDDISLVHIHFSQRFNDAVEAKQVAEQEAKRADFIAIKAIKEAEAKVNLAKGEAEAQRLLRETLTAEILQKQALSKWDGKLPIMMGNDCLNLFDMTPFIPTKQ